MDDRLYKIDPSYTLEIVGYFARGAVTREVLVRFPGDDQVFVLKAPEGFEQELSKHIKVNIGTDVEEKT